MKLTYGTVLPVSIDRAFSFISDPTNWPTFATLESAEQVDGWGAPGGRARMVTRVMGSRIESDLELLEWDPPTRFRYIARQPGRPDLDNVRVLEEVRNGTRLVATSEAEPRPGLAGLIDRVTMWSAKRGFDRAMRRLPEAIRHEQHA